MKRRWRGSGKRTVGLVTCWQALARENMGRAWKHVKANNGSAGVHGHTVLETGEYLKHAGPDIRSGLLDGS